MNLRVLLITLLALTSTAAFGAPATVSPTASAEHLGLGVTRAQVQEMFERPGLAFRFAKPDFECPTGYYRDWKAPEGTCAAKDGSASVRGRPRVIGESGTQSLDLVGPPEDIEKATLTLTFVPGERAQWVFNMMYAAGLLKEILGWEGAADWVTANLPTAAAGEEVEFRRGNRLVTMKGMADLPVVFVTIEAVESPEAVAERQAAERRAAGRRALKDGDGLQVAGRLPDAIAAWEAAARVPDTASEARSRQAHAWVQVAAELATSDTDGAMKALDAAAKVAPASEAGLVETEAAAVRVALARSLADSTPDIARRVLAPSSAAQAADPGLYRAVTIATAEARCADASLPLYAEAAQLAALTPVERAALGACALTLTNSDLEAGRLSAARQHFDVAQSNASDLSAVADLGRRLTRAERKASRGGGYDARPLVGKLMLGGGAVMLIPAAVSYGQAGSAQEEIQSGPHAGSEVEALAADGRAAETHMWLWAGGAVAVAAGGYGVLVWHAGDRHADAGRRDVRVALVPGPITSLTLAMEW